MSEKTTIQVNKTSRDRLDSMKRHPRETYDDVIQRILTRKIKWRYYVHLGEDPQDPDISGPYLTYLERLEETYDVELTDYGSMVFETHEYHKALDVAKEAYDIYLESFPETKNPRMSSINLETLPHCVICDRWFSIGHKYCSYCGNTLEGNLRLDINEILKRWEFNNADDEEE